MLTLLSRLFIMLSLLRLLIPSITSSLSPHLYTYENTLLLLLLILTPPLTLPLVMGLALLNDMDDSVSFLSPWTTKLALLFQNGSSYSESRVWLCEAGFNEGLTPPVFYFLLPTPPPYPLNFPLVCLGSIPVPRDSILLHHPPTPSCL